ncbi:BZ3500_MvSof-1268-A1-R1_Chr5-2g08059 [Microbotryum saponariae]|uniref:BZ3500_MvSof-1268-A1-R1_Chr5-2g08059 protein n=1 Tax=Microbotryum saponariae TaxID=289078 RepID=A0A2X0L1T5_9BASI|nr:BZ3500_MvSof-1268-A1-R1_Chr5-2g08059 [Microbotryum saponariae]SDA05928.1 BZ3501_MvSof-1269-A2-R1_Chr5-2g07881 [Microbotryum saponariae]
MIPATMPRPAPPAKRNSSSRTITSKSSATPSSSSLSWSVAPPKVVGLDMPPPSTHVPLNQSSSSWIDHHSSTPPESLSSSMSNAAPNHEHHHISRTSVAGSSVGAPAPSNSELEGGQASKPSVDAKTEQARLEKGKHTPPSTRRARGNGLVHPEHDQQPPRSPTSGAPGSGSSQASWDSRAIGRSAPGAVAPEDGLHPSSSTSALSSLAAGHLSPMASFPFADSTSKTLNDPDTITSNLRTGASLTVFHAAGEGLLQEYQSLRSRHDALISGNTASSMASGSESASPAKASTSRPTSSRTSSGTSSGTPFGWSPRQLALGFGVPPSSAVRPSFQTSERPHYYPRSPPPPWSAGELDIDTSRPERADSDSSSLCSPPRSSYRGTNQSNLTSPMRARDVQALSQRNEALTLQLNELEVDSEKADREGRKRLRKLEKELSELRQELDRVESVNESLKAQADIEAAGAHALKQSVREHKERYDARRADLGHERRQSAARRRRSSASDDEQNKPRDSKSTSLLLCSSSDGTGRRQLRPTSSSPEQDASLKLSPAERETLAKAQAQAQEAEEAQKAQDFVVQKLMDKIGELQETNDIITNERVEMEQRLREATVEVDEFKRRCEELEEMALMEGIDWSDFKLPSSDATIKDTDRTHRLTASEERRGIGWHENPLELGNVPAGRLKGNRRMIEKQRRREAGQWRAMSGMSQSASSRSVSSSISFSQSPTASKSKGKYPPVHRTLGSELGTDLEDLPTFDVEPTSEVQSSNLFGDIDAGAVPFERHLTYDSNNSDDDVGDDAEEELTNGSSHETSRPTPQRHLQHPSNRTIGQFGDPYYSPPEDTSRPLVPRGLLRYSGPPENADYDNLDRAASELPAAWEDEGYGRDPPAPHGLGRVGGRLLEWVEGGNDEFADEEKLWSRYPEEEEDIDPQMARLESREDVEAKSLHSLSSSLLRRRHRRSAKHRSRAGSLKRSRVVSSRFRDVFNQEEPTDEEERLTRRQVALRRMGLEEDLEYSEEGSQCDDYDSGDDESIMTDYEVLDRRARQGDYYPVSLRARYAPKMVIARITDKAMQHLVELVTYLRFFALLAMAVTFALWQGPKRALGPQPRRRRRIQ